MGVPCDVRMCQFVLNPLYVTTTERQTLSQAVPADFIQSNGLKPWRHKLRLDRVEGLQALPQAPIDVLGT